MFGSKKNKKSEQVKEIMEQMASQREKFEANVDHAEEERKRICKDIRQVETNNEQLAAYAMHNITEEAEAIQQLYDFSEELTGAWNAYEQLKTQIDQQMQNVTLLVDANKHFTSPAKHLSEVSSAMKYSYKSYEKQLKHIEDYGMRMQGLASNVAIEAEKLGEKGKNMAAAAEALKHTADDYEKTFADMKTQMEDAKDKITELEETIARLIALMKDNNVGTAKLLKKCQETANMMEKSNMRDFSKDTALIRDKIVHMRNLDEEISKGCERNKIQLTDIQEDMQGQKKELVEMESDLFYLLDLAEEAIKEAHRG